MSLDIKTATIDPIRLTFDHLKTRLGEGKTPTRYQEAVFDLQSTVNFHYRPTWQPAYELYDPRRTAIQMPDFDQLLDPRQYYYAPYTLQRARQQEAQEANFNLVERRGLCASLDPVWAARIRRLIIPLRHFEWSANTNNCYIAAYGYGAPMTSAAMMQAMDHLGIAQYLTRLALILDGNRPAVLDVAKEAWLQDPVWQPLRRLVEDAMVVKDWFELHVLQNFLIDGAIYSFAYAHFDGAIAPPGGIAYALLIQFMLEWHAESKRWTDAVIKTAAAAAPGNGGLIDGWIRTWEPRVRAAVMPLFAAGLDNDADAALAATFAELDARRARLGLGAQDTVR